MSQEVTSKFHLNTIGTINVQEIEFTEDEKKWAKLQVDQLHVKENVDQLAEELWRTRTNLMKMWRGKRSERESQEEEEDGELVFVDSVEDAVKKPTNKKRVKTSEKLKQDSNFRKKAARYAILLKLSESQVKTGLQRHTNEKKTINGALSDAKKEQRKKAKAQENLDAILKQLFSSRGTEPDADLEFDRAIYESQIQKAETELENIIAANPDVAAILEANKLKSYAQQLRKDKPIKVRVGENPDGTPIYAMQKTGFVVTESVMETINKIKYASLSDNPMVVLMGESGVGKTAVVDYTANLLTGHPPLRDVGGKHTLFKGLLVNKGFGKESDTWNYGPLLQAITGKTSNKDTAPNQGRVFFDDEFNTRPEDVQSEILKFVAACKPGQKVSVSDTGIEETVAPNFLYLAAGNPPSKKYKREKTPIEAVREVSEIVDCDYLKQTPNQPELLEVLTASLMDASTGRLRVASEKEIAPEWEENEHGAEVMNEKPEKGGFLWRYTNALRACYNAFSQKDTELGASKAPDPQKKYHLLAFVLDIGKIIDWINKYRSSITSRREGLEHYLVKRTHQYLKELKAVGVVDDKEEERVKQHFAYFGIKLEQKEVHGTAKPKTILTPKQLGQLMPNVPRNKEKPSPPKVILDEDQNEIQISETPPEGLRTPFRVNMELPTENGIVWVVQGWKVEEGKPTSTIVCKEKGGNNVLMWDVEKPTAEEARRAFGASMHKPPTPPETKEAGELAKRLEAGAREQRESLEECEVLNNKGEMEDVNKKTQKSPTWEDIKEALNSLSEHQKELIADLENPQILIVSEGMDEDELWEKTNASPAGKNWLEVKSSQRDDKIKGNEKCHYHPKNYTAKSAAKTKDDLAKDTTRKFPGFAVYVVDGNEKVPKWTLNQTPEDLIKAFTEGGDIKEVITEKDADENDIEVAKGKVLKTVKKGYSLVTHTAWNCLKALGRKRNKPFSVWEEDSVEWCLGSTLTEGGACGVVLVNWFQFSAKPDIDWNHAADRYYNYGARRAVRVL